MLLMIGALDLPTQADTGSKVSGGRHDHLTVPAARSQMHALAASVLTNAGFEDGTYAPGNDPAGWARDAFQAADVAFSWDNTVSHSGTKSVRIDVTAPNDARWIQDIAVDPYTNYRFCGWIKAQGIADTVQVVNAGANLSVLGGFDYQGVLGTTDWTRVCLRFNSGPSTQVGLAARVGMYSGTTTGTAWFDDLSLEEEVAVEPAVRVVYLVPADRTLRQDYLSVIEQAVRNLQAWYHGQLGGETFRLRDPVVEVLHSTHDSMWFRGSGEFSELFSRAADDTWSLAGEGGYNDPQARWVIYVDALPAENQCGGCGTSGVAVLARGDLQGLVGEPRVETTFTEYSSVCRYVGGLGHELGHSFGLPHPAVCDQGLSACYEGDPSPANSLLWTGYAIYPNTYFLPEQSSALQASTFFAAHSVDPLSDCKLITACAPGVSSCNGVCGPGNTLPPTEAPLYNGGVEDCLYSPQGKPQAWDRDAFDPMTATLTWDSDQAHDGLRSVRIEHAVPNDSRWVQSVPVEPQRAYRFCGWIKTHAVSGNPGDAGANVSILGTVSYVGLTGTHDWTEVCLEFDTGSSTAVTLAARVGMYGTLATGTAWFDSFTLEAVPPTATPTGTTVATSTPTGTAAATATRTPTRTSPPTSTASYSPTSTASITKTSTATATATPTSSATRTSTVTATTSRTATVTATLTPTDTPGSGSTPTPTAIVCRDCDEDDMVTVTDIVTMTNISLGILPFSSCSVGDENGDGMIDVAEVILAVNAALSGCVDPTAGPGITTPTPSISPTHTSTATVTKSATPTATDTVTTVPTTAAVGRLILIPSTLHTRSIGGAVPIQALYIDKDGNAADVTADPRIAYQSSDATILSVDATGGLSLLRAGAATVTARFGGSEA